MRGDGGRHLSADFADGGEHGQAAIVLLDDLTTDGGETAPGQRFHQAAVGHGHVVEGHQRHPRRAEIQFVRRGPADLGQQLGALEYLGGRVGDLRPGTEVLGVAEHGAIAGAGLDPHGVAGAGEPPYHGRRQRHAAIKRATLSNHADVHGLAPLSGGGIGLASDIIFGCFGGECKGGGFCGAGFILCGFATRRMPQQTVVPSSFARPETLSLAVALGVQSKV